jgi:HK97 family phage portal protein
MQFGPLTINIRKKTTPVKSAPLTIASGDSLLAPWLWNRYDDARMNLSFIRESVSAAMHARSEAIGKGSFAAFEYVRTARANPAKQPLGYDHPLSHLLREPNPFMDLSDMLELASQWLDATGNALLLKVRNGFGAPAELWLLPALSFNIERGTDELPSYYNFQPTGARIAASDIIHIKRSDIRTAPFFGHSLLGDIIDTARTETALRLYQQRFFENDAVPRAVLRFPLGAIITDEQVQEVRKSWEEKYRGTANSNKLAILPDGGELVPMTTGAKELDFSLSRRELRNTIREAFKVPKIALGDTDEVNLSNAETSYSVFMRDVVDYALGKFARALTKQLATEFAPNITVEHNNIIPESEERQLARLRELKDSLTRDEQRVLLGFPPLPS